MEIELHHGLQIKIWRRLDMDTVFISIVQDVDGKRYIAKPVKFKMEEQSRLSSKPTEPTMMISGLVGEEFLRKMAQAIQEQGIKPESDAKLEGKLEATKDHLDDMRTLLHLKAPNYEKGNIQVGERARRDTP